MPRNSSGTYTLPAGNPVVTGTLIESTWCNPTMSDLGSAITDSLDRFGRGGMLAPMRFVDGTVTAPAMAFSSETTLGLYRPSAGTLSVAITGVQRFIMTAALFTIVPPTTFTGLVTFNGGATIGGAVDINELSNNTPQAFTAASTVTPDWQMVGTSSAATYMGWSRFSANNVGPVLNLGHSRGAAVGTQTVLNSGDQFAQISFYGSDGTSFREGARIVAESDGTPGTADMPGRLRFLVSPDGSATVAEALRISNDKSALFADAVSVTALLAALAAVTVGTTLNVAGAATLQSTAVVGSNVAIPANTRVLMDRLSTSPLPALTSGTVLTLAGSTAASSPAHLQFISGNTGTSSIFFGDTDAANRGAVSYSHSTDSLQFQTAGATALTITSAGDLQFSGALQLANGTAAAPSLNFTNSATTGLFRVGADTLGIATAGVEAWRVDNNGRLISGAAAVQTTRAGTTNISPQFQVNSTSVNAGSFGTFVWTASASSGFLTFAHSRGATIGAHTIVANGDTLGRITAAGSDGTQFTEAARINFSVDGTPGVNDMPGRIEFLTTPDGANTPTVALTLAQDSVATFTGTIVGTLVNLTASGSPAMVTLNRTGSSVNCEISFTTTSGTVFAGHGPANTFAVGGASGLNSANWFNVNATAAVFAGTLNSASSISTDSGTARFNSATQGILGVRDTTVTGQTVSGNADGIVLDSTQANAGISILSANTATANIYFGDTDANNSGRITYNHSTDTLQILTGGALSFSVTSTALTLASGMEGILADVGPTSTLSVGYRGVPQNSRSAAYTLVLTDAGKHIYHPSADTTARIWTIPSNASVAFPIGTSVTFINDTSGGTITISITSDTLVQMGTGSTGSRTLTANGIATAVKVTATRWVINGTNLS